MLTTIDTGPIKCPSCGNKLNGHATHAEIPTIRPGDWSVCWHCGNAGVFSEEIELVRATPEQMEHLRITYPDVYEEITSVIRRVKLRNQ